MIEVLKEKYFQVYALIYVVAVILLQVFTNYGAGEIIGVVVIFGIIFPSLAYWISSSSGQFEVNRDTSSLQIYSVMFCISLIVVYLTLGTGYFAYFFTDDKETVLYELVTLLSKIFFFVVIPAGIFMKKYNYTLKDFGFILKNWKERKHFRILILFVPLMILFQLFVGQAAAPFRDGEFSFITILMFAPLVFLWLLLDVGLVEEFFFRAFLQTRFTGFLKSETGGILLSTLVFGLAHAPGLYLRGAGVDTPIGTSPSVLLSVCYSIVVLSLAGIFLGVIWARTKNLLLVMMIHASVDLLTNFAGMYNIWNSN